MGLLGKEEGHPWGEEGEHEVGDSGAGSLLGASPAQASGGSSLCSSSRCSGTQGPSPRSLRGCASLLERAPSARDTH